MTINNRAFGESDKKIRGSIQLLFCGGKICRIKDFFHIELSTNGAHNNHKSDEMLGAQTRLLSCVSTNNICRIFQIKYALKHTIIKPEKQALVMA